jgi:AcrR family transcriptional regulator
MDSNDMLGEGLRQRKRRATRAALAAAALRLCMQRGWENVTIEDIATATDVSPRTFRNYFSTKAEAVAALHLERMLRIADSLGAQPVGDDLWTAITNSVAGQFEPGEQERGSSGNIKEWLDRTRFVLSEPAIRGEVLKANIVAQGELAKIIARRSQSQRASDLYPQLTAAVVITVINLVQDRWLQEGPTGPITPLLRSAFAQIAAGLPEER